MNPNGHSDRAPGGLAALAAVVEQLAATGQALTDGDLTPAHASVLAAGTHQLPAQVTSEAVASAEPTP